MQWLYGGSDVRELVPILLDFCFPERKKKEKKKKCQSGDQIVQYHPKLLFLAHVLHQLNHPDLWFLWVLKLWRSC